MTGSRSLEGQDQKKHPADFALWKKAETGHIMQWSSPWGMGFPGWHIECTAMSSKYLGVPFDIHGGGMDLQFPHHEAEVAQSYAAFGCAPVNYWMHNNMMTLEGQKMAKSKGNFISLDQMFTGEHPLLDKAYNPITVRFLMLQAHYGSPIDFSNQALRSAEVACTKLLKGLELVNSLQPVEVSSNSSYGFSKHVLNTCGSCYDTMNDDFNTAKTIACLFELLAIAQKLVHLGDGISAEALSMLKKTYTGFLIDVLGIRSESSSQEELLPEVMDLLLELRQQARAKKDFSLSDHIRDRLATIGIQVNDSKENATYEFNEN